MSAHTFENMIGKTVTSIDGREGEDELLFTTSDGSKFKFYHWHDCCERVRMEDICGDLRDLIGSPIVVAEESSNEGGPEIEAESYTWTFYRFATAKGAVTVRWLGTSNGYYSERVTYEETLATSENVADDEDDANVTVSPSAPIEKKKYYVPKH